MAKTKTGDGRGPGLGTYVSGRPTIPGTVIVNMRISKTMVVQVDRLVRDIPLTIPGVRLTRVGLLRSAMERGLEIIAKEHAAIKAKL